MNLLHTRRTTLSADLKLLSRIFLSNFRRLRHPYKLYFAVTYRCNLKCRMCSIWKKPHHPELSLTEIESFFKETNDFSLLGLTGGEIFLRKDLLDIIGIALKYCRNLSCLHFPTNGSLQEHIISQVQKMSKMSPPRILITVSVDGPPEIHDNLRGIPGSWKSAIGTFVALQKIPGVIPYISMTISHGNHGTIDATIQSIKNIYPAFDPKKMMNFNFFQKSSHFYENDGLEQLNERMLLQDVQKALAYTGRKGTIKNYLHKNYLLRYKDFIASGKSPLPCQALSASCFINPFGDIFPCAVFNKTIGNIKDPAFDLKKIWGGKDVANLHVACKQGHCPGCWSPCDAYQSINGNLLKLLI